MNWTKYYTDLSNGAYMATVQPNGNRFMLQVIWSRGGYATEFLADTEAECIAAGERFIANGCSAKGLDGFYSAAI